MLTLCVRGANYKVLPNFLLELNFCSDPVTSGSIKYPKKSKHPPGWLGKDPYK